MIQPNELRIGNWFIIDGNNEQLSEDALEVIFAARNYGDINPIPLTPEILEKCGFVKFANDESWHFTNRDGYINIETDWSIGIGGKPADLLWTTRSNHCKYLHQLQNLYYALTQIELTITL